MSELQTMWATILARLPHIQEAITSSPPPSEGMPGTPSNPRRLPCNEHALSLKEALTRRATHWTGEPEPITWLSKHATILYKQLGPVDQLSFQTETHTFHSEAKQYEPAHTIIRNSLNKDLDHIHAQTIKELAQWLQLTNHPTPEGTLHRWVHEGHITKTANGYHLATAINRKKATNA